MVYLLYNKILLRVLMALAGVGVGLAAYNYITLSMQKLPDQGARDALAIVSFLISGWLVMLIAEVVDNHYARVFGALCVGLGAWISYPWIFRIDGPKLLELPGAEGPFQALRYGFWSAVIISVILLVLLITRLIIDRVTYGKSRQTVAARKVDTQLGAAPPDAGEKPKPGELPPSRGRYAARGNAYFRCCNPQAAAPAAPPRTVGPVRKLTGIGGVYLGTNFDLVPGTHRIGRQDADMLLADDNQVSRAHASITVDDGGIATVTDPGSTNGTFLNNERITTAQLAPGDVLRIGTTLFKVEG